MEMPLAASDSSHEVWTFIRIPEGNVVPTHVRRRNVPGWYAPAKVANVGTRGALRWLPSWHRAGRKS